MAFYADFRLYPNLPLLAAELGCTVGGTDFSVARFIRVRIRLAI